VAEGRYVSFLLLSLLMGLVTILLSMIPLIGTALALTLLSAVPLLLLRRRDTGGAVSESASTIIDATRKDLEVPVAAFIAFLLSSFIPLLSILAWPYVAVLYAPYLSKIKKL